MGATENADLMLEYNGILGLVFNKTAQSESGVLTSLLLLWQTFTMADPR